MAPMPHIRGSLDPRGELRPQLLRWWTASFGRVVMVFHIPPVACRLAVFGVGGYALFDMSRVGHFDALGLKSEPNEAR